MGTAGIVTHHPADHATVGGGCLRAEKQAIGFQKFVEFIKDDARLHTYPFFFFIQFQYPCPIFRYISHNASAHNLPGQRSASRTRNDGNLVFGGKTNEPFNIFIVFGISNRQRFFTVGRSIGGVHQPDGFIIKDFTFKDFFQLLQLIVNVFHLSCPWLWGTNIRGCVDFEFLMQGLGFLN